MQEFLLSIDTMWIVALLLGGFIVYQLRSGEIPLRFLAPLNAQERRSFIGCSSSSTSRYWASWSTRGWVGCGFRYPNCLINTHNVILSEAKNLVCAVETLR